MQETAHLLKERSQISSPELDVPLEGVIGLRIHAIHPFATDDAPAERRGGVVQDHHVHVTTTVAGLR